MECIEGALTELAQREKDNVGREAEADRKLETLEGELQHKLENMQRKIEVEKGE